MPVGSIRLLVTGKESVFGQGGVLERGGYVGKRVEFLRCLMIFVLGWIQFPVLFCTAPPEDSLKFFVHGFLFFFSFHLSIFSFSAARSTPLLRLGPIDRKGRTSSLTVVWVLFCEWISSTGLGVLHTDGRYGNIFSASFTQYLSIYIATIHGMNVVYYISRGRGACISPE